MAQEWEEKEREHRAYEATRDELFARRLQNLDGANGQRRKISAQRQMSNESGAAGGGSGTPPLPVLANGDVPYATSEVAMEASAVAAAAAAHNLSGARPKVQTPQGRGAVAPPKPSPGVRYNDHQYLVKTAVPAYVTAEPLYANNQPEHYAVSNPYPSPDESVLGAAGGATSKGKKINYEALQVAGLSQRDIVLSKKAEEQLAQEKRDQELAKRLQEQLSTESSPEHRSAIEAKDEELARRLQAKEEDRLRRAKERARQKKLERQLQQQLSQVQQGQQQQGGGLSEDDIAVQQQTNPSNESRSGSRLSKRSSEIEDPTAVGAAAGSAAQQVLDTSHISLPMRKPYMNRAAIDEYDSGSNSEPQYENVNPKRPQPQPRTVEGRHNHSRQSSGDQLASMNRMSAALDDRDMPVPPYMPMQQSQSKKSTDLEKRIIKKKEKEGCKQQ